MKNVNFIRSGMLGIVGSVFVISFFCVSVFGTCIFFISVYGCVKGSWGLRVV